MDEFVEIFKDEVADDALAQLLDIAQTHYAGDTAKLSAVAASLRFFAGEFRQIEPADAENAVRTWRTIFENSRGHWSALNSDVLGDLLGSAKARETIAASSVSSGPGIRVFDIGENYVVVRDGNASAPSVTSSVEFSSGLVNSARSGAAVGAPWQLVARVQRVPVTLADPVPLSSGPHDYEIPLPVAGKHTVRLLVGPAADQDRSTSKPVTLWENSQDYPFILVPPHGKVRPGKRKRIKDESGSKRYEVEQDIALPAQGRVSLHGFIYRLRDTLNAQLPGETRHEAITNISGIPSSRCHEFVLNVDAIDGAEVSFAWSDSDNTRYSAHITFSFKGEASPKEDSITSFMVGAHAGTNRRQIKDYLTQLKAGSPRTPNELLSKEVTKPIAGWELHQQDADHGWWPIIATDTTNLLEQRLKQLKKLSLFVSPSVKLDDQANAWRNAIEGGKSSQVPPEIDAYKDARAKIIGNIASQFKFGHGESVDGVNLARKAVIGLVDESLLSEYCATYLRLLSAARANTLQPDWRWRAFCLDSALLFGGGDTAPTSQILGPFHPVVLSRLFFVQQCLGERLLGDVPSSLAHVLAQTQPLALGVVLDPQMQPDHGIAFPSGDPHWLWLYRQKSQSTLPDRQHMEWLREAGLDPQAGPLGVDAEILPQTINQYIVAYPTHQTLRLSLEDCSQRSFQVLRDELSNDDDEDDGNQGLRYRLPGGLSVYDYVTKVQRVDGELLSFDPDLPLRWHHAQPPPDLLIDISTLPRSSRVDFQRSSRGGACSAHFPTARRGLVESSSGGLEVASSLRHLPSGSSALAAAAAACIQASEPAGEQVTWGTSLMLSTNPRANWTLCSAGQVDPRLFIDYVKGHPGTALWTYRLFAFGADSSPEFGRGHFLIARVSTALTSGLKVYLTSTKLSISPDDLLAEIAQAGLTLGDEFLRTGRAAEGALGQYLVQRLVWQPAGDQAPLPHWTHQADGSVQSCGFVLQVDPYGSVLQSLARQTGVNEIIRQRSDLISIHIAFCGEEMWIHPVVVESKLLLSGMPDVDNAIGQAAATARQFDHFLEFCLHDRTKPNPAYWAQPERLVLAELVHLGLRLSRGSFTGSAEKWHEFESLVLTNILSGQFKRDNAQAIAVIHHGGPSRDELNTAKPHAFVSFADTDAARKGPLPRAYQGIQKTLSTLLRHLCPGARPAPVVAPMKSVELPRADVTDREVATNVRAKGSGSMDLTSPVSAGPSSSAAASDSPDAIGKAHAAFDAAFADFIGNSQAIEKLRDDLVDALIKQPPHLASAYLLTGNPSTGKTTLANKVAALLGVTFIKLVGTNVRNESDLIEQVDNAFKAASRTPAKLDVQKQGIPEFEYPECLIFIDEIHLVKGRAQEGLLTLTEPKDRYVRLRDRICLFPRATYMAATTRDSEIDRALRTRFGNPIHLNDYKESEVAQMLAVKRPEWAAWSGEIRLGIARLSRRIPREAERLAQKLERKLNVSREQLTLDAALEKLRVEEGLDRNGLDRVSWDALQLLAKQHRPIGRETLAQTLGTTDEEKLVTEVIPALHALELVEQVSGGQQITDRGRNYLRNEAPPSAG